MNQQPDLFRAERTTTTAVATADLERATASVRQLGEAVHGTFCRRKKPTPFVINTYCEFVTSVGLNIPPFQFPHVPPRSGLNSV